MKRMGAMLGAHSDTFSGLTGLGDLIVTCNSTHSRNWNVGYRVGKGEKLDIRMGQNGSKWGSEGSKFMFLDLWGPVVGQ